MFSVMNATMLTWMDHIREAQEFRGKWKSFGFFGFLLLLVNIRLIFHFSLFTFLSLSSRLFLARKIQPSS